jgi:hypothetical protein
MNVEIENVYSVEVVTTEIRTLKDSLTKVLEHFKDAMKENESTFYNEEDLKDEFIDYILEDLILPTNDGKADIYESIEEYSLEFRILNWEEVYAELSYLVVPRETNCCADAPINANYCPTCGNRLK